MARCVKKAAFWHHHIVAVAVEGPEGYVFDRARGGGVALTSHRSHGGEPRWLLARAMRRALHFSPVST